MADCFLETLNSQPRAEYLHTRWCKWVGAPGEILRDGGENSTGPRWGSMSSIYGVAIICALFGGEYKIGQAARRIQISMRQKKPIGHFPGDDCAHIAQLSLAVTTRNITTNSFAKGALSISTGRTDFFGMCRHSPLRFAESESGFY